MSLSKQNQNSNKIKLGDLLFQYNDNSKLDAAINGVELGFNGHEVTHVGMVVAVGKEITVIESIDPKVRYTPLHEYLHRHTNNSEPEVFIGRLKSPFQDLISGAIESADSFIGMPYDRTFIGEDQGTYCSDLIIRILKKANNDNYLIANQRLQFHNPNDPSVYLFWVDHYSQMNMEVPEKASGSNPAYLSKSEKIEIIFGL